MHLAVLALVVSSAASAQDRSDLIRRLEPLLCVAPDPALKGRTDFYDAKGRPLLSLERGAAGDAVAVVLPAKRAVFSQVAAHRCPEGKVVDARKLRELSQAYAIGELIAFDRPDNRVRLKNGLFSETRTYLYKGKDGLVHPGREKLVGGDAAEVDDDSPNAGGIGYETQGEGERVGRMHTHPNSDNRQMLGVPRHHPSPADVSNVNARGYYDLVLTPKYVFFINNKNAGALVVDRARPVGDSPVKDYVVKAGEADDHYARAGKFPAWFDESFNRAHNPWAR